MPNAIENRIVNMLFQNEQFEKGANQTINTLDTLEKKLKLPNSSTAFDNITKAANSINLSGIRSGLESLSDRFSNLGIVGMTVLQNLTNSAVDLGKKLLSAIPQQIISGGKTRALNIEQAKFQLSGLNVAWEDIYDNIDAAVKGTAYGLDEAAKIASQLAASGVAYGDAESQMAHTLRAVSGVAAMTNSSYEDIGSIFTTVAGQGVLMTYQLRQLESRGLNAAAKLGEKLGKSEEDIRKMVTKGEISFETFANVMDECFGEHATKANETFTGALSNMKAALSRIGADFATPILNTGRDVFNGLRVAFDKARTFTKPFAENGFTDFMSWLSEFATSEISKWDFSWIQTLVNGASKAADTLQSFLPSAAEFVHTFSGMLSGNLLGKSAVADFLTKFGEGGTVDLLSRPLINAADLVAAGWEEAGEGIATVFTSTYSFDDDKAINFTPIYTDADGKTHVLSPEELDQYAHDVVAGVREDDLQLQIGAVFEGDDATARAEAAAKAIHKLQEQYYVAKPIIENVRDAIADLWETIKSIGGTISSAWERIFPGALTDKMESFSGTLLNLSEKLKTVTSGIKDFFTPNRTNSFMFLDAEYSNPEAVNRLEKIKSIFSGLFAIIDLGKQAVEGFGRGLSKLFSPVISKIGPFADSILDGAGSLGEWLVALDEAAESSDFFGQKFEAAADWVLNASQNIKSAFETVKGWASDAWKWVSDAWDKIYNKIGPTLEAIWASVQTFWDGFKKFIKDVFNGSAFDNLDFSGIGEFFSWLVSSINWDAILNVVTKVFEFVGVFAKGLLGLITSLLGGDTDGAAASINTLSDALTTLAGINLAASITAGATAFIGFISELSGALAAAELEWNSGSLLNMGKAVAYIAGSLLVLSLIDEADLDRAMNAILLIMAALTAVFKILNNTGKAASGAESAADSIKSALTGFLNLFGKQLGASIVRMSQSKLLVSFAEAILMIAGAVWLLASIPADNLSNALNGVIELIVALTIAFLLLNASMEKLQNVKAFAIMQAGSVLTKLAIAILILAVAVKLLSGIEIEDVWSSVGAIAVFMAGMILTLEIIGTLAQKGKHASQLSTSGVKALSSAMTKMAIAILIMAAAVWLLSSIDSDTMWNAVWAVTIFIGSMIIALELMGSLAQKGAHSSKTSSTAITAMGNSMILIAVAVMIMAATVKMLSDIDPLELANGFFAVEAMLISLVLAMLAMAIMAQKGEDKANSSGKTILAMAASMVIIAVALGIMANSVKKLGELDWLTQLLPGVIAMIAMMIAMVGSMALLMKVSEIGTGGAGGMVAAAASILIMAVALAAIAPAIASLGQLGWSAMAGVGVLTTLLLALIGIAALVGAFPVISSGLKTLAKALALIGVAALAFGAGLALAAAGIAAFAAISAPSIAAFVAALGLLLSGIATLGPQITAVFVTLIAAVVDAIVDSVDVIINGIGTLITAVVQAIIKYGPVILYGIAVIIDQILQWLADTVPTLVDDLVKLLLIVINSLSIAIAENGEAIGEAIASLVKGIGYFVISALYGLFDGIIGPIIEKLFPEQYAAIKDFMEYGKEEIVGELQDQNEEIREGMKNLSDSMSDGFDEAANNQVELSPIFDPNSSTEAAEAEGERQANAAIMSYNETVENADIVIPGASGNVIQPVDEMLGLGTTQASAKGSEDGSAYANSMISSAATTLQGVSLDDATPAAIQQFIATGSAAGIVGGETAATDFVDSFASTLTENEMLSEEDAANLFGMESLTSSATDSGTVVGEAFDTSVGDSIEDNASKATSPVDDVADAIEGESSKFYSSGYYDGAQFGQGVISGIKSKKTAVYVASASLADTAKNAFEVTAEIQSPSKVAAKLGMFWGEGVAIGISDMGNAVSNEAGGLGEKALDGMRETLRRVKDVLSGDLDPDMTIRPVIDLSSVREGARELGSLFSSQTMSLSAGVKVPDMDVGRKNNQNASKSSSQSNAGESGIVNNFYVQNMDEAHIEYFIQRVNREIGRVPV